MKSTYWIFLLWNYTPIITNSSDSPLVVNKVLMFQLHFIRKHTIVNRDSMRIVSIKSRIRIFLQWNYTPVFTSSSGSSVVVNLVPMVLAALHWKTHHLDEDCINKNPQVESSSYEVLHTFLVQKTVRKACTSHSVCLYMCELSVYVCVFVNLGMVKTINYRYILSVRHDRFSL